MPLSIETQRTPLYILCFGVPLANTIYFSDNFTVAKWILVYAATLLTTFVLATKRELYPKLNSKTLWSLSLVFGLFSLNTLYHQTPLNSIHNLDRLCFVVLTLYCYKIFSQDKEPFDKIFLFLNSLATLIVCGLGAFEFYSCVGRNNFEATCFPSTFGNINMTAQYLALSNLFLVYQMKDQKDLFHKFFTSFVFVISLTYIYFSLCRSAYIGTILFLGYCIYKRWPISRKQLGKTLALSLLLIFAVKITSTPKTPTSNMKPSSTSYRIEIWQETLRMIQAHPLGVGTGQFEFGFLPFQTGGKHWPSEDQVYKSPHSTLLRLLAEDGVILSAALFLLFYFIFKPIFRPSDPGGHRNLNGLFVSFLLIVASEFLFQFPLENAHPFFNLALFTGLALSWTPRVSLHKPLLTKGFLYLVIFSITALSVNYTVSKFYEATAMNDYEKLKLACTLYPYNWRPCMDQAKIESTFDINKSMETLKEELERRPYNFVATQIWAVNELKMDLQKQGCISLIIRDAFFKNNSQQSSFIEKNCSRFAAVQGPRPDEDHKEWLRLNQILPKTIQGK